DYYCMIWYDSVWVF
nr:immunoglobulin light chain junction region [Macaca mulatta]MOX11752.1 immunoglobulin light chain junction region [Macaca mulatta]MOX12170.1 immunoglobulin light chain junction region [Macaca mulatta]MOX12806.1 immunoglobulin light chain junction region [Macaca mulatta]MOX13316.1 immunoglobulin light chain junction region [Macaca mulatta]